MKTIFKTSLAIIGIAIITLFACKKDEDPITPETGPTNLKSFFEEKGARSQFYTVKAENGGIITAEKGTKITIPANAFKKANGTVVTGNVTIEVKEIFEKSEMILSDKPTVSYGQILVSGGELFVGASQNGEELSLNGTSLSISTPTENPTEQMGVFSGVQTDSIFSWVPRQDTMGINNSTLPYSYIYSMQQLGWINCDYFYNNPNPRFDLKVKFSNHPAEVCVFYVFNEINSVLRAYDFDRNFEFEGSQIPQGMSITVVALGLDGKGKYFLGTETLTLNSNTIVTLSMSEASSEQIKTALDAL